MRNTKGNPSDLNEKIPEKNLNPHKEIKSTVNITILIKRQYKHISDCILLSD